MRQLRELCGSIVCHLTSTQTVFPNKPSRFFIQGLCGCACIKLLANAEGDILADDTFLDILNDSKQTYKAIEKRMNEASTTAARLNEIRQLYKPLSRRGSLLYLSLCDLRPLNPFYQWSLETFKNQLQSTLANCQDPTENRKETLKSSLTWDFYCNSCRGLFDAHRLVLAFLLAKAIDTQAGNVSSRVLEFLLRGVTDESIECAGIPQVHFWS